jgi:hypothetical protein
MTYYATLNLLNVDPVTCDLSKLKERYQTQIFNNDLNPKLITALKQEGIVISFATSFYSDPLFFQEIHIDYLGGDYVKLNYVYSDTTNSTMNWYSVKNTQSKLEANHTQLGNLCVLFKRNDVELMESTTIRKCFTLVQVGCPHNICNDDEYRLCITLILRDQKTYRRLSMADAITRLSKYIG